MAELTLEQKRAIAVASARLRVKPDSEPNVTQDASGKWVDRRASSDPATVAAQGIAHPSGEGAGPLLRGVAGLFEGFGGGTAPIHSPLQTLAGLPQFAQDLMQSNSTGQMARMAQGKPVADPLGATPVVEKVREGDYAGAAGYVPGMVAGGALTGKVLKSGAQKIPAAVEAVKPTHAGMLARSEANRAVGGNLVDNVSKSGNSLAAGARAARNVYAKAAAPAQEAIAKKLATPAELEKMQYKDLQQKLSPSPTDKGAVASSIRNAPRLAKVAPELLDTAVGPEFDAALVDAFRAKELAINKAADAVPAGTMVSKAQILPKWRQIVQEANSSPFTRGAAAALQNSIKAWNKLPDQIPWDQFRQLKQQFLKDTKTPTFRKAYQELMDIENSISTDLQNANADYSVVRRALDDAKIIVARDEMGNIINAQRVKPPKKK